MVRVTSVEDVDARIKEDLAQRQGISTNVKVIGTSGANLRVVGTTPEGRTRHIILSPSNVTITDTRRQRIQDLQQKVELAGLRRLKTVIARQPTPTEEALQASLLPELRGREPAEVLVGADLIATPRETGQIRITRKEKPEISEGVIFPTPRIVTARERLGRAVERREIVSGILGPRAIAEVSGLAAMELLFPPFRRGVPRAEQIQARETERLIRGGAAVPVGFPAAVFQTIARPTEILPTRAERESFRMLPEATKTGFAIATVAFIGGRPTAPKPAVPKIPRFRVREVTGIKMAAARTFIQRVKGEPVILGGVESFVPTKIKTEAIVPFKRLKIKDPLSEFIVREVERGKRVERVTLKKDIELLTRERITIKPPKIIEEPVKFVGEAREIKVIDILGGKLKKGVFRAEFLQPVKEKEPPFIKVQVPTLPREKRTPFARTFLRTIVPSPPKKRPAPVVKARPEFFGGPFAVAKMRPPREVFAPIPVDITMIKEPKISEFGIRPRAFGEMPDVSIRPLELPRVSRRKRQAVVTRLKPIVRTKEITRLKPVDIQKELGIIMPKVKPKITPRQILIPRQKTEALLGIPKAPITITRVAPRPPRRPPGLLLPPLLPPSIDITPIKLPRIRGFKRLRQPKGFRPSLVAFDIGFTAPKVPKGLFTGLEIRPVIVKKKKRKKKKR